MSNKNVLHINGTAYDATTGKRLHVAEEPVSTSTNRPKTAIHHDIKPAPAAARAAGHTSHALHKKSIKGKTLRRELVKKPSPMHERKKATSPHLVAPSHTLFTPNEQQQAHLSKADQQRLARATAVTQSHKISRFGNLSRDGITKTHGHLPVAQPPTPTEKIESIAAPILPSEVTMEPVKHAPVQTHAHDAAHKSAEHPKPKLHHRIKQKIHIPSPKSMATAGLAALLLGGFFAYQHIPLVAMQVAERRAGIDAKLPGAVAGYGISGPIQYSPGQITISFKSNTDDRAYKLVQRSSSWNSEALKSNFVALKDTTFETILSKGRTVYLYGKGNATWVDGGVWYSFEGNDNLAPEQILAVTASL